MNAVAVAKRASILAAVVLSTFAATLTAWAQSDYPQRPVKIIIPYAPGGSADNVGRIVGRQLGAQLEQPFVIENVAGSSGIAAMNSLLRAPADGYTLFLADAGVWAINVAMQPGGRLTYDPLKDLLPIGTLTYAPLFMVVHQSVPASDLKSLVMLLQANPGKYSYASSGIGSPHHLAMETFKSAMHIDVLHVPFKGSGQSLPALVSGEVSMALVGSLPSVETYIKSGRLKLVAVSTSQRSDMTPGVPTMAEAGIKDFNFPGELALFAPRGTPQNVIDKLSSVLGKAITTQDAVTNFKSVGVGPAPDPSAAHLLDTVRTDLKKYGEAVRISGAKID